jgi:hypothetical protein
MSREPGLCPYLEAAGLGQLDKDAWRAAATHAEGLLLFRSEFQPPPGKVAQSVQGPKLGEDEGRFVRPAHLRTVSSEFKGAHQLQALALAEFPGDKSAGRYKLPPDVRSAISVMLQHGTNLPTLRESQVAKLRRLARICKPITEEMKRILAASRPPSVRAVGDCMNVAFALVLAKSLRWPHYWIGRALLLGFPITGVMESTGVLRPRDEQRKGEEFDRLRVDILADNKRWLYAVHDKATARARSAQDRANKGDRESLETLQRVERQTLKEIGKGHMGQPWSLSDLLAAYTNLADGSMRCRVLLRSGVLQDGLREEVHVGPDGRRSVTTVRKLRVIDDAKRSRHNDLQLHCETIHL